MVMRTLLFRSIGPIGRTANCLSPLRLCKDFFFHPYVKLEAAEQILHRPGLKILEDHTYYWKNSRGSFVICRVGREKLERVRH